MPKNKKGSRTNTSSNVVLYLFTKDRVAEPMYLYTQTLTPQGKVLLLDVNPKPRASEDYAKRMYVSFITAM